MSAIALDAMGGDNAPSMEVAGALRARREDGIDVLLVGDEEQLRKELRKQGGSESDCTIVHATEVVTMDDNPGKVFRKKLDSSMRVATDLVLQGKAAAMVSAGNSGAVLSHALFQLGRVVGVDRPGIVQVFPTPHGRVTMCDLGANIQVTPTMLAQFGVMGVQYHALLNPGKRPRLGVLANGTEKSKGTALTREACELLQKAAQDSKADFEFVGHVEGSGVFEDKVDVVATDGFTGNVFLKTAEGVSEALTGMIRGALTSSARAKLGALLAKPALRAFKQSIDYAEFGGAMLVGVKGLATICHGRSNPRAIQSALVLSQRLFQLDMRSNIREAIARHEALWEPTNATSATGATAAGDEASKPTKATSK